MFGVEPLRSPRGHLLGVSLTCTNKHKGCCYLLFFVSGLQCVAQWLCLALQRSFRVYSLCVSLLLLFGVFWVNPVFFIMEFSTFL